MGLATSPDCFEALAASLKDHAVFLVDPAGHVATWNAAAASMKGYAPEEVIGKPISIFYTPEDLASDRPRKLMATALKVGRVEDVGWRVRKDGTRFWAEVVMTRVGGQDGGVVSVTRDLTNRTQAERAFPDSTEKGQAAATLRQTQDAMLQSEESLRATLYSIGDGVLATDERGCVTRVNPVAERLTGWRESEALGRPIEEVFEIVNEETRAKATNPVVRVLAEGVVVGLANHTALISRDGVERPIADSGAPILDAQGRPRGAVLVFRDVTDERAAEEALRHSEERLRSMIASVRDYALYMLDPEGRVVSWNPGAERIKGYRQEEILGQPFSRFFTPEDVAQGKPARELERAIQEGRFEEEGWRVRKDGSRFWANVVVTPIRDGSRRLVGFVKITQDLTERRRAEDERLRLAQAAEAIRLRDEFLSIASHELKTPLTALQLQLFRIHEQMRLDGARQAADMDRALRVVARLGQLIEALLDVSRIASGGLKLNPEPFDLSEAARDVIERLRDWATASGCELSLDVAGPLTGRWDRVRVEQVLMNLISNAIRYAAGQPIHVSVKRQPGAAVIEVRDKGPGVPATELSRIFERFERAASSGHYGGMGLGLYVTRQIVEAHGGTIQVRTSPDVGACFIVRLPVEA